MFWLYENGLTTNIDLPLSLKVHTNTPTEVYSEKLGEQKLLAIAKYDLNKSAFVIDGNENIINIDISNIQ